MKSSSSSSSFKRRIPTKTLELPKGLRASPSSSLSNSNLPLFSTGLTALDDLISGRGQPSSSSLLLLPSINTASSLIDNPDEDSSLKRSTSEPYTELVLAYGLAQGLVADHKVILVGNDLDAFTRGVMAKIGEEEEVEKEKVEDAKLKRQQDEEDEDEEDEDQEKEKEKEKKKIGGAPVNSKGEKMDIAWRYEKMKQFKTSIDSTSRAGSSVGDEQDLFCSVYDLSKRISPSKLQKAKRNGNLELISIDQFNQAGQFDQESSSTTHNQSMPNSSKQALNHLDQEDEDWEKEKMKITEENRDAESIYDEINSFEVAFETIKSIIDEAVEKARQRSASSPPSQAIRICLRSLGSLSWKVPSNRNRSLETIKFLSKLKILLRNHSFSSPKDRELLDLCEIVPISSDPALSSNSPSNSKPSTPSIPIILTASISAHLLSTSSNPSTTTLSQLLSNVSDSTILFSNFQISNILRTSFPSYTGGIKILKTPRLGTLLDSSIKTSILRGMGNTLNSFNDGSGGAGGGSVEGGTGGTENNLAFKLKRKKFVVETLHLDVDKEDDKKKKENFKEKKSYTEGKGVDIEAYNRKINHDENRAMQSSAPSATSPSTPISNAAKSSASPVSAPQTGTKPAFGGLKALRQRGLAEQTKHQSVSSGSSDALEVSVGSDEGSHRDHSHPNSKMAHPQKNKNGIKTPIFKSDKMKDYEF